MTNDKPLSILERLRAIERLADDFRKYPNSKEAQERLWYIITCILAILIEKELNL